MQLCTRLSALERYVKLALDSWNEDGQARIRFEYKGFWVWPDDDNPNNPKVIIRADGDGYPGGVCGGADACAWRGNCDANGCKNGHVAMKKYQYLADGNKVWRTMPVQQSYSDFVGILLHELGHILGLNHPWSCQQYNYVGVMACDSGCNASLEARYLRRDDIEGLRNRYGWKNTSTAFKKSTDALTWSGGTPSMPNYNPDLRMSTVSTDQLGDDQLFLAFPYGANAHFAKYDSSSAWSSRASIEWTVHGDTWKNVAITMDKYANNYVAAAWLAEETVTNDNQKIRWAYSQNEGSSWSYGYFQAGGVDRTTRRNGISGAWDPQTSTWVFGWVDDNNHLTFQTLRTPGMSPGATSTSELTIDSPAITCSGVSGTLPYNCLVTFASSGPNGPCLMYTFGKVNGSGLFEMSGTVYSDCWYQYQTAYVTSDYQNSMYPFVVGFRQAGNTNYTFRKTATPSSGWQDQRSFAVTPSVLTASIGLYRTPPHAVFERVLGYLRQGQRQLVELASRWELL